MMTKNSDEVKKGGFRRECLSDTDLADYPVSFSIETG
jgi:hypothetical protein